ncbi:Fc.00g050230.m01.CDS01 [Cosmosporella sp. VM-42]
MAPRKEPVPESTSEATEHRSLRKRGHQDLESIPESDLESTPTKRRRSLGRQSLLTEDTELNGFDQDSVTNEAPETASSSVELLGEDEETPKPTPKRRGRPPKAVTNGDTPTPRANRTATLETPTKPIKTNGFTPGGADRSARRKSARALIEHVVGDGLSDEEGEDAFAREIYESSDDADEEDIGDDEMTDATGAATDTTAGDEAATPSKTPKRRGRPKKVKSPTPPRDLPPHELYFTHNKPGRPKTSNNTLDSLALLTHEEYFNIVNDCKDRHSGDVEYLESLHADSFPQWTFELSQGFSICLYGFGSKRRLLHKLAKHLHSRRKNPKSDKIVIVNGYAPTTTLREILSSVGNAIDSSQRIPLSQPSSMVHHIISQLSTTSMTLTLLINSIDAPPLRKPGHQAILAQLAAHPQVQLVCSADTPDFSLLWDIGVRSNFTFLFHDCTTFAPYTVELDIVDEVHELLGRAARRVNGREGVAFVLRSLPENAKNLFRLIVGEVLIAMEEEGGEEETGVEYRMVYNKAVEEFICSSEMAFRTLLKEFHDHQIITSRKDTLGTELLALPFRKDELEAILEDLMS